MIDLLAPYRIFCPSRLSSLSARSGLAVENFLSPVMAPIISLIACIELRYLLLADVTGSCRPRMTFLDGIVLKFPMIGGRDLYIFEEKMRRKGIMKKLLHYYEHASRVFRH